MNRIKFALLGLLLSFAVSSLSLTAAAESEIPSLDEAARAGLTEVTDTDLLPGVSEVYTGEDDALVVVATTRGLESDVTIAVSLSADGTVDRMDVLAHGETPALGGMALSEEYLQNYTGTAYGDSVDAYTGATITSDAIRGCADKAFMQYMLLHGIEFERPMTAEDLRDEALKKELGEDYEELTLDSYVDARICSVYASETGYACYVEGTGHDAEHPIRLVVAADTTGTITGITVVESSETEGIGSNVLKDTNLAFYVDGRHFTLIDMGDMTKTKIDVVSGATETSFGVFKMINAATQQFDLLIANA